MADIAKNSFIRPFGRRRDAADETLTPYIRTFGRIRGKRLSERQQFLIDAVLPTIRTDANGDILEIGFGAGENMMRLARAHPDKIIIGAEPFINGIASLLSRITDAAGAVLPEYKNIRIFPGDVRDFLASSNARFEQVYILHPDPWPKARHEKRRLCSHEFLSSLPADEIIIGTDHTDYYDWIREKNTNAQPVDMAAIETKYQKKNMFGSDKTMYLKLKQ